MAKRRRQRRFKGTPKEHKFSSKDFLRSSRASARSVRRALARGDCRDAILSLAQLGWSTGGYVAEKHWADTRKGLTTGKPLQGGADRVLGNLAGKVMKRCALPRK